MARDDVALDLRRAAADRQQQRVAHVALDVELHRVARPAVDLQAAEGGLLRRLARQHFRDRSLPAARPAGIVEPGGMPENESGGMDLRVELGEQMADRLVLADPFAELLALLGIRP